MLKHQLEGIRKKLVDLEILDPIYPEDLKVGESYEIERTYMNNAGVFIQEKYLGKYQGIEKNPISFNNETWCLFRNIDRNTPNTATIDFKLCDYRKTPKDVPPKIGEGWEIVRRLEE